MAQLAVQKVSIIGVEPSYQLVSSAGDTFVNQGDTYLYIKNESVMSTTVTIKAQKACSHGSLHDITLTIPAESERTIGAFPVDRFNDLDGKVFVKFSSIPAVKMAAIKL
jgi:hypothetical protein